MNDTFCYLNENSLSKILCDEIMELFEESDNKHDGAIIAGMNKHIKDTIDLPIHNDTKWSRIYNFLEKELSMNVENYIANNNVCVKNLFTKNLFIHTIHVQK